MFIRRKVASRRRVFIRRKVASRRCVFIRRKVASRRCVFIRRGTKGIVACIFQVWSIKSHNIHTVSRQALF